MQDDVATTEGSFTGGRSVPHRDARLVDRALLRLIDRLARRHEIGRMRLTLPSGASSVIGASSAAKDAELHVRRWRSLIQIARRGALGFAESYMDGDLECQDLKSFFELYMANELQMRRAMPRLNRTRRHDWAFHTGRRNTRDGSRRNIADHYDLGNAFYSLWLDPSLLYSSGIYAEGVSTLEAAQARKLERILECLSIEAGSTLLEIGCGWGALAEAAARRGASVRAVTISEQQLVAARERIAATGLSDRANVVFEDYRDTTGSFDRLVSVEMIEAVGEENWPLFFETIAARLAPGGIGVIQAITIREDAFEGYRANPDFIQRYIFPGGMLPTIELMRARASSAGLAFETIERFGGSYALTLSEWRRRFEAAWPQIAALGFDERFRRMWRYYLTYCEVGFEHGLIDVGLYRLCKPASSAQDRTSCPRT
jgi:cyclopropane-fatty-acyl-phospholipid synthase